MKSYILILSIVGSIFISCASSSTSSKAGSESKNKVNCIDVGSYDNSDLNTFLKSSVDLCNQLSANVEKLDDINDFVEDPSAWMAMEVSKATSPYKEKLRDAAYLASNPEKIKEELEAEFAKMIAEEIVKEINKVIQDANTRLSGSSSALNSAKGLDGMEKLSAAKDVANASKNYKATVTLAKELLTQTTRLMNNLKG